MNKPYDKFIDMHRFNKLLIKLKCCDVELHVMMWSESFSCKLEIKLGS